MPKVGGVGGVRTVLPALMNMNRAGKLMQKMRRTFSAEGEDVDQFRDTMVQKDN